jgi:hypothetical protein
MTTQTTTTIPDGYMANAAGHLVPIAQVREHDMLRDRVARDLAESAIALHAQLVAFKTRALSDIIDLIRIAGERYEVQIGGSKGNVTITSYDGQYRVQRHMAERIAFTEEIEVAKELINSCITRWSEGADVNIRALVDRAFRTDSKGQIKTAAVLELMRLEIDDPEWKRAMQAIADSIQSTGTAIYIRVYQRIGDSDQYRNIPLDLASV